LVDSRKAKKGEDEMQGNAAIAGTADATSSATPQPRAPVAEKYTDEQVRQLVIALEDPFDPREIKWRVTNTTSDKRRGQVIAYADPRAYTDRLNALFTVRGWTRDYLVQVIQNFERKERGNGDGVISAKIVVTCRLTIDGLGSHSGLGEEWADNENAGTAAEAQAFKRACTCFGLGRYLYDLGGVWVDLDDRKQPLSTPRLPDWAFPKRKAGVATGRNGSDHANGNGHKQNGSLAPADLPTLQAKVKSLCEQVGCGLARSVTKAIAATEDPEQISNVAVLVALSAKLEDTFRGVERLRAALRVVGLGNFSRLCQQMNLAGDGLDDIPDRSMLRQLIEALEKAAGETRPRQNGAAQTHAQAKRPVPEAVKVLGAARADLVREAQRVGRLRNMKVSDVVDRAANGAFQFTDLQRLPPEAVTAVKAAIDTLRQIA
jgi:hypothetical protein